MKLTTCQLNQTEKMRAQGWIVFDITIALVSGHFQTVSERDVARCFAPTWDMVKAWNKSKRDDAAKKEYTDEYIPLMRESYTANPGIWTRMLTDYSKLCFACFCKSGDFCHRTILVGLLKKVADSRGIECEIIPEGKKAEQLPLKEHFNGDRFYAGIGSRETPKDMLHDMTAIAIVLAKKGYTLRSGGAKGADTAFEEGATTKEIFRPKDVPEWCYEEVKKHLRKGSKLEGMKDYVQALLARNMQQILGKNGDKPVEFVVCWTPAGDDGGGTGYAIRCADRHGITVYNLKNKDEHESFYEKYMK